MIEPLTSARAGWRASNVLLALWIALIGADRIDLLGGATPFAVTPFLALTPIVICSELIRGRLAERRILVTTFATCYLLLSLALVSVASASVFLSPVPATSAERATLLAVQIFGSAAVALMVGESEARRPIMAWGAAIGMLLFVIFACAELGALMGAIPETLTVGPTSFNLAASIYGAFIPRLAGPVADANRGGPIILFYLFLLQRAPAPWTRSRWWTVLAVTLILATLSRSVILGAAVTWTVVAIERRDVRLRASSAALIAAIASALIAALLLAPRLRDAVGTALAPLLGRLSFMEGSAQSHFALVRRGLSNATESLSSVLFGHGYGSAYYYLQDMFPGSRYGNYHAMYVSMFAEAGIFALIIVVLLIAVPLVRRNPYRPLIAGVAAYNVFYQLTTEPVFWTMLAFAWFSLHSRAAVGGRNSR